MTALTSSIHNSGRTRDGAPPTRVEASIETSALRDSLRGSRIALISKAHTHWQRTITENLHEHGFLLTIEVP